MYFTKVFLYLLCHSIDVQVNSYFIVQMTDIEMYIYHLMHILNHYSCLHIAITYTILLTIFRLIYWHKLLKWQNDYFVLFEYLTHSIKYVSFEETIKLDGGSSRRNRF